MVNIRVYLATDVHGSEMCFRKFVNAGKFYKADVAVLGGDLTGKMIVPIVEQSDGTYRANYMDAEHIMKTPEEVCRMEETIRLSGFYPYHTRPGEIEELNANPARVDDLFTRLMVETMERWVRIAEENLKDTGIKCFVMPGNDDRFEIDSVIEESDYVANPEGKVVSIGGPYEMISTGYVNITPWNAPRDIPEEELAKKIEEMAFQVKDMGKCVFNFHCPPYDSEIDAAPKLDETLKPILLGAQMVMIPAGSRAVRSAIERHQPLLGLHGHIHESRGAIKIGKTLCLNPGSEYTEGILRGTIINLGEKGVRSHLFVTG